MSQGGMKGNREGGHTRWSPLVVEFDSCATNTRVVRAHRYKIGASAHRTYFRRRVFTYAKKKIGTHVDVEARTTVLRE